MKRIHVGWAIAVLAVAAATGFAYGQDARAQSGSPEVAAQRLADPAPSDRPDSDTFINEMAVAGMAEVELGKIAACRIVPWRRAATPSVP